MAATMNKEMSGSKGKAEPALRQEQLAMGKGGDSSPYSEEERRQAIEAGDQVFGAHFAVMDVWAKNSPVFLNMMTAAIREAMKTKVFSMAEAHLIQTAISATNRCVMCLAFHTTFAIQLGVDPEDAKEVRDGGLPRKDARQRSLIKATKLIVAKKGQLDEADREMVRKWGLKDAELFEICALIGLMTAANYANHVIGVPPIDESLKPGMDAEYSEARDRILGHSRQAA